MRMSWVQLLSPAPDTAHSTSAMGVLVLTLYFVYFLIEQIVSEGVVVYCSFIPLKNIRRISILRLTVALCSSKIRGLIFGGVPERSKGADCKSAGSTFGGSNPPPSTISEEQVLQE